MGKQAGYNPYPQELKTHTVLKGECDEKSNRRKVGHHLKLDNPDFTTTLRNLVEDVYEVVWVDHEASKEHR